MVALVVVRVVVGVAVGVVLWVVVVGLVVGVVDVDAVFTVVDIVVFGGDGDDPRIDVELHCLKEPSEVKFCTDLFVALNWSYTYMLPHG